MHILCRDLTQQLWHMLLCSNMPSSHTACQTTLFTLQKKVMSWSGISIREHCFDNWLMFLKCVSCWLDVFPHCFYVPCLCSASTFISEFKSKNISHSDTSQLCQKVRGVSPTEAINIFVVATRWYVGLCNAPCMGIDKHGVKIDALYAQVLFCTSCIGTVSQDKWACLNWTPLQMGAIYQDVWLQQRGSFSKWNTVQWIHPVSSN